MNAGRTATMGQLWLPGQAAAPAGPVNMLMMYVSHHAFRRDLADFAAAVPVTPVEDLAAWQAMQDRWTGFARVLQHHHHGEDAGFWPLLLARVDAAGDRAGRATLEAMEAEHERIDPLLASCADGLAGMAAGGSVDNRAALAVRVLATRDALGRHLAHEEIDAIALMQRYLTDDEWTAVQEEHFQPPKRLREVAFTVPWACKGVPADVRDRAFAEVGLGFKLMWLLSRRRFDRLDRTAFAHLTAAGR